MFEIYIALKTDTPIAIQFGNADEQDFRAAISSSGDGRARIHAVLNAIRVEQANASVPSDREYILGIVEGEMGLERFNVFIRDGIKREYASINRSGAFH